MFSKSSEYALKLLMYLSQHSDIDNKIGAKELAEKLNLPFHFIGKILQKLSKKELVGSQKGPNGGFYTTKDNLNNTLADIIKAIDGPSKFNSCVLGLKECSETRPCPLHHSYKEIKAKINTGFSQEKLSDFIEKLNTGNYFLSNIE